MQKIYRAVATYVQSLNLTAVHKLEIEKIAWSFPFATKTILQINAVSRV